MTDIIRTVLVEQKMIYEERIAELIKERDEARREVCVWQGLDTGNTPRETAAVRGWDCYKENNNA
jgi:hypothetical protein